MNATDCSYRLNTLPTINATDCSMLLTLIVTRTVTASYRSCHEPHTHTKNLRPKRKTLRNRRIRLTAIPSMLSNDPGDNPGEPVPESRWQVQAARANFDKHRLAAITKHSVTLTDLGRCTRQWLCHRSQSQTSSGSVSVHWRFCRSAESGRTAIPASLLRLAQGATMQSIC